jgi:hypothetical protein
MKLTKISSAIICAFTIVGLSACSSSGSDGSGPATTSGSTIVGNITGFGSIIMSNGVEYDTENISGCEIDDESTSGKCDDNLNVGMRVSLKTDVDGAVTSVHYDDELEGVATNVTGSNGNFEFEVFGVTVATSSPETQWDDFAANPPILATDLEGKNVEISGEWQSNSLIASYVEKQDDSDTEFEAKGTVSNVSADGFTLTLRSGTTINVVASENPTDGSFIEIKGTYVGSTFTASEIEVEDIDNFDDESEIEVTGKLVANSAGHSINTTNVDISNASSCTDLVGKIVEAEGVYNKDTKVLVVEECEDEDEELEMKCDVSGVSGIVTATPKVGTVMCDFPGATGGPVTIEFRDSPNLAMFTGDNTAATFDLRNVTQGDCVEIKASIDTSTGTDIYVAGLIEHEGAGACGAYELEGPVEASTANSITSIGITYVIDGSTIGITPSVGETVKIKDDNGDGTVDVIED